MSPNKGTSLWMALFAMIVFVINANIYCCRHHERHKIIVCVLFNSEIFVKQKYTSIAKYAIFGFRGNKVAKFCNSTKEAKKEG